MPGSKYRAQTVVEGSTLRPGLNENAGCKENRPSDARCNPRATDSCVSIRCIRNVPSNIRSGLRAGLLAGRWLNVFVAMKPWTRIKEGYCRFVRNQPGERFMNLHRRWHARRKGPAVTAAGIIVGAVLIVAGGLLALVPGVPGIVPGIAGVALIAAQFPMLARACDRSEVAVRRFVKNRRSSAT